MFLAGICVVFSRLNVHTKILPEVSYGILLIDQLLEDDFFRPILDVVHGSDPRTMQGI